MEQFDGPLPQRRIPRPSWWVVALLGVGGQRGQLGLGRVDIVERDHRVDGYGPQSSEDRA